VKRNIGGNKPQQACIRYEMCGNSHALYSPSRVSESMGTPNMDKYRYRVRVWYS